MPLERRRFCNYCDRYTLHVRPDTISTGMGCLLCVVTCFLFLPIWFLALLCDVLTPMRCQRCGEARYF